MNALGRDGPPCPASGQREIAYRGRITHSLPEQGQGCVPLVTALPAKISVDMDAFVCYFIGVPSSVVLTGAQFVWEED